MGAPSAIESPARGARCPNRSPRPPEVRIVLYRMRKSQRSGGAEASSNKILASQASPVCTARLRVRGCLPSVFTPSSVNQRAGASLQRLAHHLCRLCICAPPCCSNTHCTASKLFCIRRECTSSGDTAVIHSNDAGHTPHDRCRGADGYKRRCGGIPHAVVGAASAAVGCWNPALPFPRCHPPPPQQRIRESGSAGRCSGGRSKTCKFRDMQ